MSDVSNKIATGASWNTLTVVIQVGVQLVYTALLARLIAPESFALMGVTLGLVGFAEIFSQVGIGPALIQRKEINAGHINAAFVTSGLLGLGFTALFFSAAPFIADFYQMPLLTDVVRVVSLAFVISALAIVPRSMMIKALDFKSFFKASMVSIIGGNLVVGLLLAWLGYDVWAYVFALFAQNVLMTLGFWLWRPVRVGLRFDGSSLRQLLRYGAGSTLFNALNYFATKLDVLMVPKLLAGRYTMPEMERLSAMYERSAYVMSLPITVLGKLSDNVMFSGLAAMQEDRALVKRTYFAANALIGMLILPMAVFVVFFAEDLIRVYLGPHFTDAADALRILFVGVAFRALVKTDDALLRASDKLVAGSAIKGTFLLVVFGLGLWWADMGITGMAWAMSAAAIFQFVLMKFMAARPIGFSSSELWSGLRPAVFSGGLTAVLCAPVFFFFPVENPGLVRLALAGILVAGGFLMALRYARFLFRSDTTDFVQTMAARLPNRSLFLWVKKWLA